MEVSFSVEVYSSVVAGLLGSTRLVSTHPPLTNSPTASHTSLRHSTQIHAIRVLPTWTKFSSCFHAMHVGVRIEYGIEYTVYTYVVHSNYMRMGVGRRTLFCVLCTRYECQHRGIVSVYEESVVCSRGE